MSAAAVTEASDVPDEDLVRSERVAVQKSVSGCLIHFRGVGLHPLPNMTQPYGLALTALAIVDVRKGPIKHAAGQACRYFTACLEPSAAGATKSVNRTPWRPRPAPWPAVSHG